MKKVESVQEYQTLVKTFRKEKGRGRSNCFFTPSEVETKVYNSVLFTELSEEALCFYVQEPGCFRLYYYLAEDKITISRENIPVLCDITFRGDEDTAIQRAGAESLSRNEFERYKTYLRMELLIEDYQKKTDFECSDFKAQKLQSADYREAMQLWNIGLDEYSTALPDRREFEKLCKEEGLLGIYEAGGKLIAISQLRYQQKTALFEHLTVFPAFRGKGIGNFLFQAALIEVFEIRKLLRMNLWVDRENQDARRIYEKNGMHLDGLISIQYIRRK